MLVSDRNEGEFGLLPESQKLSLRTSWLSAAGDSEIGEGGEGVFGSAIGECL